MILRRIRGLSSRRDEVNTWISFRISINSSQGTEAQIKQYQYQNMDLAEQKLLMLVALNSKDCWRKK